jgi:hypothetical protein
VTCLIILIREFAHLPLTGERSKRSSGWRPGCASMGDELEVPAGGAGRRQNIESVVCILDRAGVLRDRRSLQVPAG